MKIIFLIYILTFYNVNGQEFRRIKIKHIQNFEKVIVFKFKDLKTKKIDYFFSYKEEACDNSKKIERLKKYELSLSEINVWHQQDGNKYLLEIGGFKVPDNHKLYYSEKVKGLYLCP